MNPEPGHNDLLWGTMAALTATAVAQAPPSGTAPRRQAGETNPAPASGRAAEPAVAPGAAWKALITATSHFDPENDSRLLAWMADEAAGMVGYAGAVGAVHETAATAIGLDPAALQALDDCAAAAASTAGQMAAARQRFTAHCAEVRQFTADGGVLPYNGRWMTGENPWSG